MSSAIIERIKKLLALAQSSNENEAAAAMAMATKLMIQHGIDTIPDELAEADLVAGDKKWQKFTVYSACKLYGVQPVSITGTDKVRMFGRHENVEAAAITLKFIQAQIEFLYKAALPRGMSQRERAEFRVSFKEACANRVWIRVNQIITTAKDQGIGSSTALVVKGHIEQLENEAMNFAQTKFNGLKTKTQEVQVRFNAGSIAGRVAGDMIRINQEVE